MNMIQEGQYEQIRPFNFYTIRQFQYQQLISRNKYFVGLYTHKQTKLNYVVKQIPYSQHVVQILKKIDKLKQICLVPLQGVCLHRSKTNWRDQQPRIKNQNLRQTKQYLTLLLFMEKQETNLHDYVISRRKKNQAFSQQEINSFIQQTLTTLQKLQKEGMAHRDIKPQNILLNKDSYLLCDFEDIIDIQQKDKQLIQLTTVEYSSPQFLRNMRQPKDKFFDPFKLDLYSLGLTLMFMCSMGRFSLQERSYYIYESSQRSHADFIKEQRRKWITKDKNYKIFNSLLKMMLEQDQYKRDDFVTINIKLKNKGQYERAYSDYKSDDKSTNTKSSSQLKNKKAKKLRRTKKQENLKRLQRKVYGILNTVMIVIFLLFCLL